MADSTNALVSKPVGDQSWSCWETGQGWYLGLAPDGVSSLDPDDYNCWLRLGWTPRGEGYARVAKALVAVLNTAGPDGGPWVPVNQWRMAECNGHWELTRSDGIDGIYVEEEGLASALVSLLNGEEEPDRG